MVSLGTILSPKLTSLHHIKPDLIAFKTLIRRSLFFLSFFILILSFIAPFVITLFFGEKYLLATNYVSLAFLGLFLNIFAGFILMLVFSVDSTKKYWTFISIVTLLLNFVLTLVLIPVLGLMGLVLINWAVNGVLLIYVASLVKRKWKIGSIRQATYFLIAAAFIISAFFVRANIFFSAILCVALVTILFLFGWVSKVILPEDLHLISSGVNYLFRKISSVRKSLK